MRQVYRWFGLLCTVVALGCSSDPLQSPAQALRLTLEAEEEVILGARLEVTVRVTNVSSEAVRFRLGMNEEYAFDVVALHDTDLIWRSWDGFYAGPAGPIITLAPRSSRAVTKVWNLRNSAGEAVAPGDYALEAELHLEDGTSIVGDRHQVAIRQ